MRTLEWGQPREDHVSVPGGLVEPIVNADQRIQRCEGLAHPPGCRCGDRRVAGDGNQTADAAAMLKANGVPASIMIDCSHANSGKDPSRQPEVWKSILEQRAAGRRDIVGAMLESHLEHGSQPLEGDPAKLRYGVSITDACLGWDATAELFHRS